MESKLDIFLDPNFKFNENSHTYTYLGNSGKPIQVFESVTSFINRFKKKEDWVKLAGFVARRDGIPTSKVLEQWENKGKVAVTLGSAVHKWIEDYYNGLDPKTPDLFKEDPRVLERIEKFKDLHQEKLHKLTPVKQEFRLFSRKWNIAGTTDAIFKIEPDYFVGDWKTNEKFTTNDHPKGRFKKLLYPFEDLWENSLNIYSIQLSLYRLILQEEAGFSTRDSFLVWIGPEKPKLYKVVDLRDRLYNYLQKNNDMSL